MVNLFISKKYEWVYNQSDMLSQTILDLKIKLLNQSKIKTDLIFRDSIDTTFQLTKRRLMRDSFNPVFFGRIIKNEGGLKVTGRFSYDIEVTVILLATYFIGLLVTLFSLTINGFNVQIPFFIGILLLIATYQWIATWVSMKKRREIIEFIETFCGK